MTGRLRRRAAFAVAVLALATVPRCGGADEAEAFLAECGRKAEAAQGMAVPGREGWLFLRSELRHLGSGRWWKEQPGEAAAQGGPLAAIVDYRDQLARHGIELVVVPVPPKAVVYPDMISDVVRPDAQGRVRRLDVHHQAFYALLREKGVDVLDLTADFMAHRLDAEGAAWCRTDTHWSGLACARAARALADRFKPKPWFQAVPRTAYVSEAKEVIITGDLAQALQPVARPAPEKLMLRFVGVKGGDPLTPVEPDASSPVILLADSHGLVFHAGGDMHAMGAGLADQLALEMGFAVDVIAVRGSGATPARAALLRRANKDAAWLGGKKALIWCFSAREFTESADWRLVPLTRSK